jgi:hypothetical protein
MRHPAEEKLHYFELENYGAIEKAGVLFRTPSCPRARRNLGLYGCGSKSHQLLAPKSEQSGPIRWRKRILRRQPKNKGPASAAHQTELDDLFGQCMAPKPGAWGVQVPKKPFSPHTESTEFCG